MLILAYDFETTGLPLFKEPSSHPDQPHIVQVGACLVDSEKDFEVISSIDLIVRPDGWDIPEEVAAIHGITTEHAETVGVCEGIALDMLLALWDRSHVRMGHNEQFDARIARIAIKRIMVDSLADEWKEGESICTMRMATPIVQSPPTERMKAAGRHHFKNATLSESYLHFTGKPLEGAHSAMVDVLACIEVYRAITALHPLEDIANV